MSTSPSELPDRAGERQLHARLVAGDLTASFDLATIYLEALISRLTPGNRKIDPALVAEAADEAILSLIRNPAAYQPERMSLLSYLSMAAQGDLKNLLRKERKHRAGRKSLASVELSPQAGKYLGRGDDPSFELVRREQEQVMLDSVPASLRDGLSDVEAKVWELMVGGERRTSIYAAVMGITGLPAPEQKKEVKRLKDRLKKRRERAGGEA
jgi:hypothetical protein